MLKHLNINRLHICAVFFVFYFFYFGNRINLYAQSKWVSVASDGTLIYKTTPKGDRIMDFSSAGYMGGGVAFPNVPVKKNVHPPANNADATDIIQAAIDAVAALPVENDFHGAVLLEPGTYYCDREIRISTSGIVIRGSGSGEENASIIRMTGDKKHPAININSEAAQRGGSGGAGYIEPNDLRTTINEDYIPSGANSFKVASAKGFTIGDIIQIRRKTTEGWVHFMGMDNLVRNGKPQTWLGLERYSVHIRRIVAIDSTTFTVDVPMSDSFDAEYFGKNGVEIIRAAASEPVIPLSQIGVEHLRIQCPPLEIEYGNAPYAGVRIGGQDCWVDDVWCVETMNTIPITGRRVTIRNTHVTHTYPNLGASKPADFSIEGSQILIDRCSSNGSNTYWVWTNSYNTGPNVLLNSDFTGRGSRIQPHQRWATGFLVDNCRTPDGGIDFSNRGVAGSGHGWCMGWGVAWNCTAKTFIIQNPPGAINWAIGCIGERLQTARYFDTAPILPEGIFESHGTPVAPRSLYLAQLAARLGYQAVESIGYAPGAPDSLELENPATPTLRWLPPAPIDPEFGEDLGFLRPVNTDSVRHTLEIDTEGPLVINAVTISEPGGIANVRAYKIEGQVDSDYKLLAEGTTIGLRKTHTFPPITVWKVRLTILQSDSTPAITELRLYYKVL